ncbi:transporter substrate-binding domain-containing protein [Devosia rhodophyticola]|uniref:Transporter substrate-binding domain-containing protein n=1 Tax=Devosia rhodophyticola TaxID=3026423 RepID=A0ABY7YXP8_9HYPH|nr:transporter substrate-binding domain-containing protein [Devosia rhodophyticola]WDR06002.1 transporter substrate-binding domain-containing protein [Devosia rhodophyticola]
MTSISRRAFGSAVAVFAMVGILGVNPAAADTLDNIKDRGTIVIGIQGDNPPFGFLDSTGNNDGYDADLSQLFAKYLGVDLKLVVVTNQNRIAALQTGKVDALFATLGISAERAKSLQYSIPYAEDSMPVIAPIDTKIASFADLDKLTVGVPKGSTQENTLPNVAPDAKMLSFDDDSSTIQALLSGQVDAIGTTQFAIKRIDEAAPGKFAEKIVLATNYKGVGTILGDKTINATVNEFIEGLKADGTMETLYQKWFKLDQPKFEAPVEGVSFTVP